MTGTTATTTTAPPTPTAIIVGGPAGTGKTTVGELLAQKLKCPFVEGDKLHPKANVDKMAKGIPLTDDDRWDWLKDVALTVSKQAQEAPGHVAIASCSSLTVPYRNHLRAHSSVPLKIVFLWTTKEEMVRRVSARKGHYMGSNMVESQYDLMQVPDVSKEEGTIPLETNKTPEELVADVINNLHL